MPTRRLKIKVEDKTMAIVTISRQAGSLGDEIARSAADKLGYRYIEKNQISETLSKLGFSVSDVDKYDEKKPSVWQTLSIQKKLFAHLIQAAVYELAKEQDAVIVGRGGQIILKDIPGALHVRVIAPYAERVTRLMEEMRCEEKNAQRIIRRSDRDSSGYLATYFDADWDDSALYDLVINTRTISPDTGVRMITGAVEALESAKSPSVSETLNDRALTHKARAALIAFDGLEIVNLVVEKGVVTLSGLVRSSVIKDNCAKTLATIEGIASINNQLNVADNTKIY